MDTKIRVKWMREEYLAKWNVDIDVLKGTKHGLQIGRSTETGHSAGSIIAMRIKVVLAVRGAELARIMTVLRPGKHLDDMLKS